MVQQPSWQRFSGTIAENYQRHLVPMIFAPWAEELVSLGAPQLGERVLDVACGPGVVARLAARCAGAGQVTGLDLNPGMLEVARSLPSELAISWEEGSALQMPFPDEAFDLVLCQQGVQFFPDRAAGLREMWRVLVPGGRMVVAVWGPIEQSPGFAALAAALERHVSPAAAVAARSPFSLSDLGELHDLLTGAGLGNVEAHARGKTLRFPPPAEFVAQYVSGSPIAATLGDPDPFLLEAVAREVAETLASYLDGRVLSLPMENHLAQAVRPSRTPSHPGVLRKNV